MFKIPKLTEVQKMRAYDKVKADALECEPFIVFTANIFNKTQERTLFAFLKKHGYIKSEQISGEKIIFSHKTNYIPPQKVDANAVYL